MECRNPHCPEENPEFYKGRKLCKRCHNKECSERKRRKRNTYPPHPITPTDIHKEIIDMKVLIETLSRRMDDLFLQR